MRRKQGYSNGRPPGLLDCIAAGIGCIYLSDLHRPGNWPGVLEVLGDIDPRQHSLYEWSDMIHYITGRRVPLRDKAQAVQILRQFLRANSVKALP